MIKKIFLSFSLLCIINAYSFASGDNWPVGGRSAGMANASVTLNDLWSVNNNQAGLSGIKNISDGLYYENRYGLKELSLKAGAIAIPTKAGVIALSVTSFGYAKYNEGKIGLAYAKAFGDKFSAGVQLDYLSTYIGENYGFSSTVAAEIGLRYQMNKNLCIGAHVFNPTKAKVADYNDERAPTVAKLGLSYSFSDKVIVAVESEKDIQYKPVFKAGVEYRPVKQFYFRTGISTNPVINAFGFGLEFKHFNFDFATTYHRTLGYTPQVSLIIHGSKSDK
jgi:hypothetical protein